MKKFFPNYYIFSMMNFLLMMTFNLLENLFFFILFLMFLNLTLSEKINIFKLNMLIIIFTIFLSALIYMLTDTNWFSSILFLIMIGGMMILFLYFNSFMTFPLIIKFKLILKEFLFKNLMINLLLLNNLKINFINIKIILLSFNEMILYQMLFNLNSLFFFIFYLLVCLIIITFLCSSKNFSMRKMI